MSLVVSGIAVVSPSSVSGGEGPANRSDSTVDSRSDPWGV